MQVEERNVYSCDRIYLGPDDEAVQLLHDNTLVPHWKELANALQLYQHGYPNSDASHVLSIFNVQLTSSVIDLLTSSLEGNQNIRGVSLESNEFVDREGIDFALEIVGDNPNLEQFDW